MSGAKLGTLRNISWKFELTPTSFDKGVGPTTFWPRPTDHVRSIFLSGAKLGTLRNNSWKFELYSSKGYRCIVWTIFLAVTYWPCPTYHVRSKFLSDAKLGTLNFLPNPSSHYRGVVQKKIWPCPPEKNVQYFWQTFRQTDEKNLQI